MFRRLCAILITILCLAACRDQLKSKEQVQQAIVERLKAHTGLDLNALDITTTDVQFDHSKAVATVSFHPKGDAAVNSGMTMKYNLEERDGKWVVTGVANSQGSAVGAHPSLSGSDQPSLPSGHPAIPEPSR